MGLRADLFAWLTAQTPLAAVVADRVFPMNAPPTAAHPFVTFRRNDEPETESLEGEPGIDVATFIFEVVGDTPLGVEAVAEVLKATLKALGRQFIPAPGGTGVLRTKRDGERDLDYAREDGSPERIYVTELTYRVWYAAP